jgi:hypothetical protein
LLGFAPQPTLLRRGSNSEHLAIQTLWPNYRLHSG